MVANPIWDPEAPLQSSDDEYVSFSDDDNDVDRRQARPIITQQWKRRLQDRARGLRNGVHKEMNEVVKSYTQTELMELAKVYKHEVGENVGEWLLRMWDGGADSVQLNAREALCMGQLTLHPQLMQVLRRVREIGGNFSLFDMVRHAIIVAFPSSNDMEPISPWSKPRDAITRIRVMGCVVGLNKDNWEGPDMEEFTASMQSRFLKSAPQEMKASLLSLLGSLGNNVKVHQLTTYLAEIGELESESNPRKDTAPLSIPLFQHCAPYAVPPPSLQAQDNTPHIHTHICPHCFQQNIVLGLTLILHLVRNKHCQRVMNGGPPAVHVSPLTAGDDALMYL
ncbi:Hypothetical predicted protein [Pelobates cultripes]|uniref:Uncharacterized protein n=1 Tax=Pelobates cultripes TaxID=61616 RepID=A0AAD1S5B4_PELCU|nr:Hypothetical predicted protein [Pelobates cultripes]